MLFLVVTSPAVVGSVDRTFEFYSGSESKKERIVTRHHDKEVFRGIERGNNTSTSPKHETVNKNGSSSFVRRRLNFISYLSERTRYPRAVPDRQSWLQCGIQTDCSEWASR